MMTRSAASLFARRWSPQRGYTSGETAAVSPDQRHSRRHLMGSAAPDRSAAGIDADLSLWWRLTRMAPRLNRRG